MSELFSADDTKAFNDLDQFALLACQKYNLSNEPDWFGPFRGGLYGFYARLRGVQLHYRALHDWFPPRIHDPTDTEYHLSSVFFNMDSAIECLTFALNALGFAVLPKEFKDIGDHKQLSNIAPHNILGNRKKTPPLPGYEKIFPGFQNYWKQNQELLERIIELHDVSKHRTTIYQGGQLNDEPPTGFFESLGGASPKSGVWIFSPHKEILLMTEPKLPRAQRTRSSLDNHETLEELVPKFANSYGSPDLWHSKIRGRIFHCRIPNFRNKTINSRAPALSVIFSPQSSVSDVSDPNRSNR